MENPFKAALDFTLPIECGGDPHIKDGYVNDPHDAGGETKYGISKRSYPNTDIKSLRLIDAISIYHRDFWLASGCNDMAWPFAIAVFDFAVNSGVGRAKRYARASDGDWRVLCGKRLEFVMGLNNPRYERGWVRRVNELKKYIDILIGKEEDGRADGSAATSL